MIRTLYCGLTLFFISFFTQADVLTIKPNAPQEYVVKKGDTLWDISAIFLQSPWKWPKLWGMNPQIDNPHLIYPGDLLSLIYDKDGNPQLVLNAGKKQVKMTPGKRFTPKQVNPISTIALNVISPYLNYERALVETEYNDAAFVIGGETNTKVKVAGDLIYATGELVAGELYGIYRQSRALSKGLFNKVYAEELILTGTARALELEDQQTDRPARLRVLTSKQEIRSGDRLMFLLRDHNLPAVFSLSEPKTQIEAEIISSSSSSSEFSKLEVVLINSGSKQDLRPGNVLGIYRKSPDVLIENGKAMYVEDANKFTQFKNSLSPFKQFDMPVERVGEMVVFKTYNEMSYALITDTKKALSIGDLVSSPSE